MEDTSFANQCVCKLENKTKTLTCSSECTCEKDRCCPKTREQDMNPIVLMSLLKTIGC